MGGHSQDDDPLTAALAPPPDETNEQRAIREQHEAAARAVSQAIDDDIAKEKKALAKKKRAVKVLLLGQSESGKSTTLKNFQFTYARKAWQEERGSWRSIVQLNLVRNVNSVISVLSSELARPSPSDDGRPPLALAEKHQLLKLRLSPLKGVQKDLETRLGASSTELDFAFSSPFSSPSNALPTRPRGDTVSSAAGTSLDLGFDRGVQSHAYAAALPTNDFFVRSSNGWKSALDKLHGGAKRKGSTGGSTPPGSDDGMAERDSVTEIIAGCEGDMRALWEDGVVREMLRRRGIRMEDQPGFFLDDISRVASRTYEPSDDDVLRARLRTLGVQEHRFVFDSGKAAGTEWLLYDVGGHRSARASWAPYFDDVDAIIFLAPVNAFDEKLAEDQRVNRLEDTYLLWKAISRNKILARTQIVLFLNKIDLLKKKLKEGVRIADHVPSYGDRPNDVEAAVKYFQAHFKEIAKAYNPEPRTFYVHHTSVVDTKATATTLAIVEEGILRNHLKKADLL